MQTRDDEINIQAVAMTFVVMRLSVFRPSWLKLEKSKILLNLYMEG